MGSPTGTELVTCRHRHHSRCSRMPRHRKKHCKGCRHGARAGTYLTRELGHIKQLHNLGLGPPPIYARLRLHELLDELGRRLLRGQAGKHGG